MKHYPDTIDSYESTRDGALKKIRDAAKDSDNELLEDIAAEEDPKERAKRSQNCEAVRRVVEKGLEEYREGEYTFKECVAQICDAIKRLK